MQLRELYVTRPCMRAAMLYDREAVIQLWSCYQLRSMAVRLLYGPEAALLYGHVTAMLYRCETTGLYGTRPVCYMAERPLCYMAARRLCYYV